ncbi:hypothetical protein B566_EDAN002276 [Ephemera danica]|nr:hypothetical protein B566_EDAN002276 [Ephemera danica]
MSTSYNSSHHRQEGSSPPEAAIEATPETTPVKARTNSALQKIVLERQKVAESSQNGAVENQGVHEESNSNSRPSSNQKDVMEMIPKSRMLEGVTAEFDECSDSACVSGGLHMPNKQSLLDFARRVNRLRVHSVCVPCPTLSAGASPSEGAAFPLYTKVRRTVSCPDMKRSWIFTSGNNNSANSPVLDEKEEEEPKNELVAVNGSASTCLTVKQETKQCLSFGTQTSGEQWPPQPYEHLFLAVFPSSPEVGHQETFFCPYTLLDQYIEASVKEHSQKHADAKKAQLESEQKSLRSQLHLLHLQLQFERHRREVHAERNRRLTGKSRSNRALEEHNAALKEQVVLLQKDYEKLQSEMDLKRQKMVQTQKKHEADLVFWKNRFDEQHKQNQQLNTQNQQLRSKITRQTEDVQRLSKELEKAQSVIFDLSSECRQLQECASVGERLGGELNQLQREMMLLGELQQRQQDHLVHLPLMSQHHEETLRVKDACKEEIAGVKQQLEVRSSSLEAAKMRILELESIINKKENLIVEEKKLLKAMKDEYSAKLNILEVRAAPSRTPSSHLAEALRPLSTVTTTTEMTDLHSIVDPDLPPTHKLHTPPTQQPKANLDATTSQQNATPHTHTK